MITLKEDQEFLSAQRLEGRQGSMISKDMSLSKQESRRRKRDEEKQHRAIKALQEQEKLDETVQLSSSSSSPCSQNELSDEDAGQSTSQMALPKHR